MLYGPDVLIEGLEKGRIMGASDLSADSGADHLYRSANLDRARIVVYQEASTRW
jgi:hypothetical protein